MSNSMVTRMVKFIQSKFNRLSIAFLLCLLLSCVFWLLTSLSKEYMDEVRIPVVYKGLPEDVLIANEPVNVVKAKVKGYGFDLMWYWLHLERLEISVSADPSDLSSIRRKGKEFHYVLTHDKNGRMENFKDDHLEILSISPDTLFLRFTPKFIKLVPVRLNAEISIAKQFGMVSDAVLIPDSILLIGPKKDLDTISFVLTEPQSWKGLKESLTTEVKLMKFRNLPLVKFSQTDVRVELNVLEFTEGSVIVPLRIEADRPESVRVFPHEVEIRYQVPLSSYDSVNADQFQATVVLNEKSLDKASLTVKIEKQPDAVTQLRIIPSQVEYIIQK